VPLNREKPHPETSPQGLITLSENNQAEGQTNHSAIAELSPTEVPPQNSQVGAQTSNSEGETSSPRNKTPDEKESTVSQKQDRQGQDREAQTSIISRNESPQKLQPTDQTVEAPSTPDLDAEPEEQAQRQDPAGRKSTPSEKALGSVRTRTAPQSAGTPTSLNKEGNAQHLREILRPTPSPQQPEALLPATQADQPEPTLPGSERKQGTRGTTNTGDILLITSPDYRTCTSEPDDLNNPSPLPRVNKRNKDELKGKTLTSQ